MAPTVNGLSAASHGGSDSRNIPISDLPILFYSLLLIRDKPIMVI